MVRIGLVEAQLRSQCQARSSERGVGLPSLGSCSSSSLLELVAGPSHPVQGFVGEGSEENPYTLVGIEEVVDAEGSLPVHDGPPAYDAK